MASKFPLPKYHFKVEINSIEVEFQEVSGLDLENEFTEYRGGNDSEFIPQRRVSMRKSGTLSLKKGIIKGDNHLKELYEKVYKIDNYHSQDESPISITISLLDQNGTASVTWVADNVIPIKLSTESLNSTDNSIAIEQIDFSHSGIKIQTKV